MTLKYKLNVNIISLTDRSLHFKKKLYTVYLKKTFTITTNDYIAMYSLSSRHIYH